MEEKLYQFLLVDKEHIQESTEFVEYTSVEMYEKLKAKYKNSLAILEYILKLAEMKKEQYEKEGNVAENKCIVEMDKIKKECEFNDDDIKMFKKYIHEPVSDSEKKHYIITFDPDKLENLEKYEALRLRANFEKDKYYKCRSVVGYITDLKKMFYHSYGFNSLYENREWENTCEKLAEELQKVLEGFYILETEIEIVEPTKTDPVDKNETEDDEYDYIQPHHLVVFDAIIKLTKEIANVVDESDRFKKNWKVQRLEWSYLIENISDLIEFNILVNEKSEAEELSKSDQSGTRESIVSVVKQIEKKSRGEVAFLGEILPHDEDYAKYKKLCERLSTSIKLYDSNRRGKTEHFESEEEKTRDKKLKAAQKRTQDDAYREMQQVLIDIRDRNKDALDKIRKRIEYKTKYVKADYYNKIDVSLYKSLFDALKNEVRKIYKEGEERAGSAMVENRNQIFQYKDKVIVTLTFPNTDIEKFKTAAFVVDEQDLRKVYVDSGKCAWTYKHSRKAPKNEYDKKTLKPDKITTKGGSVDLMQVILGDYEQADDKRVFYVTESHKFDMRKDKIRKVDKLVRKPDLRYHQGKIRIEENNISETVCFNNEINTTDASILYFDDMNRLADFLDNMQ